MTERGLAAIHDFYEYIAPRQTISFSCIGNSIPSAAAKWALRKYYTQEDTYPQCDLISTHAGHHTFICFALSSGIPPQVVMKWTGHSDYQAMKLFEQEMEK